MTYRILISLAALAVSACGGGFSNSAAERNEQTTSQTQSTPRLVRGAFTFDGRETKVVVVEDRDGWAYWQGDIILGRTDEIVTNLDVMNSHQAKILGDYRTNTNRWTNGVLVFDATSLPTDTRALVRTAMQHISLQTPLRFTRDVAYSPAYQGGLGGNKIIVDKVVVSSTSDPNIGGSSSVGRIGGSQPLLLNTALSGIAGAATVAHELLHALGVWHEQSREDRNNFVQVNYANTLQAYASNFDMHISDGAMHQSYDYCSLMHYGRYAFSNGNGPTIIPNSTFNCSVPRVDQQGTVIVTDIGQFVGLSAGDTAMLNFLYSGAPPSRPLADAGDDQNILAQQIRVQLDGRLSSAVTGATIVKYEWKPAGGNWCPGSRDCNPNPIANFNSPVAFVWQYRDRMETSSSTQYRLTVTDNLGRTMSDVVTVRLHN